MPEAPRLIPDEGQEAEINPHDFVFAALEKASLKLNRVKKSNPADTAVV